MSITFVLRLDPNALTNPDLDLRYVLPDAIVERSGGTIRDDAYDYEDGVGPRMLLFLIAENERALAHIVDVLRGAPILDNDLSETPVAIKEGRTCRVVHPASLTGTTFTLSR